MDAPRCIVCQQRHWSTQPCPAFADPRSQSGAGSAAEERKQQARKILDSVTKPPPATVTKLPEIPVTKLVTEPVTKPINITPVTKPKGGRPLLGEKPMSAAERMRLYRQRRREARQ